MRLAKFDYKVNDWKSLKDFWDKQGSKFDFEIYDLYELQHRIYCDIVRIEGKPQIANHKDDKIKQTQLEIATYKQNLPEIKEGCYYICYGTYADHYITCDDSMFTEFKNIARSIAILRGCFEKDFTLNPLTFYAED